MRNFCCGLILLLATGVLFSCGSKPGEKKYFDIPGYFEQEIDFIKGNYTRVEKTTLYNGKASTQQFSVSEINWEKELAIFMECNINKPVYYANLYENEHGDYQAVSKKIPVQKVDLDYAYTVNGVPQYITERIELELSKSNLISDSKIVAEYYKGHFYKIHGERTIKILGDNSTFMVEGKFLK